MQPIVDTRMSHHSGIGTYLSNLLPHIPHQKAPLTAHIYSLIEQWQLARLPVSQLFWSPHFNVSLLRTQSEKQVTTIHDLFHLDWSIPIYKKAYAKLLLSRAVHTSIQLITVSHFSKTRLLHHFPKASSKIHVIYPGADHLLNINPIPVPVTSPFYLFVGSTKPHKNLALLKQLPINLFIVDGSYSLGQLVWLYQNAEALIFPSLYEGWGLPPLEAMSLGCPVLASNSASIPEACDDAALYFDPTSLSSLKEALSQLPSHKKSLIAKGKKRSAGFTWEKAAEQHLQILS